MKWRQELCLLCMALPPLGFVNHGDTTSLLGDRMAL